MIEKIDGNTSYNYQVNRNPAVKAYEAEQKKSRTRLDQADGSKRKPEGVILDLSMQKQEAPSAQAASGPSVLDRIGTAIQSFFSSIGRWLKAFWESEGAAQAESLSPEKQEAAAQPRMEEQEAVAQSQPEEQAAVAWSQVEEEEAAAQPQVEEQAAVAQSQLEEAEAARSEAVAPARSQAELLVAGTRAAETERVQQEEAGPSAIAQRLSEILGVSEEALEQLQTSGRALERLQTSEKPEEASPVFSQETAEEPSLPEQANTPTVELSESDRQLHGLFVALSIGELTLDDLDASQVSRLIEAGVDLEAASQGNFDYSVPLARLEEALGMTPVEDALVDQLPEIGEEAQPFQEEEQEIENTMPSLDDSLIQQAAQDGSLSRLEELITENGRKRLAHNSDLLTFYDRKGHFVRIDDTQKHRVLYGDKNILKL